MIAPLANKANAIFYQVIAWGVLFFLGLILLGIKLYPQFIIMKQHAIRQMEAVCGCTNPALWSTHALWWAGVILMGLFLFVFVTVVVIELVRFITATNQFLRKHVSNGVVHTSPKLKKAMQTVGSETRVQEVRSDQPLVFCHGFFEPRICIASALVERLGDQELLAVLFHEQHHVITRQPIKMLFVKLFRVSLWFVPWFNLLTKKYFTYVELAADEHATVQLKDKTSLARALDAIISWGNTLPKQDSLALSFFETVTEERINTLMDDRYIPRFPLVTFRSIASSLALGFLVLFSRPFFTNAQMVMTQEASASCVRTAIQTVENVQEQCTGGMVQATQPRQNLYGTDAGTMSEQYSITVDN